MPRQNPTLNKADISLLRQTFTTKQDLQPFAQKKDLGQFATKSDLKRFATKQDLKQFATKDDLRRFATKQDLRGFATKQDLVWQRKEIIDAITDYLAKNYVTKTEFNELKEHIRRLPTKDEFFERMDEIAGDYQKFLQERDTIRYQLEQVRTKIGLA